ncbi:MAG: M28 family peptidase [Melioribacteraceae bacterium]|nr:M28 family peptidase [Melioribacteraceae bacterium]
MIPLLKRLLILIILSGISSAQELKSSLQRAFDSINPLDAYTYCKKIASAEFEGRLTGSEGYEKAARWAADKFNEWGLKPIDDEHGYLQHYNAPFSSIHDASMQMILPSGDTLNLVTGDDFLPMGYCDNGSNKAHLVFAGWGISAPHLDYDDYELLNVKDKYVLCFRGTPDTKNASFQFYDEHRTRMKTAFEKGALGLFYIYPKVIANPNGDHIEGFMPAIISEKIADKIFSEKNFNAADLRKKLTANKTPVSFGLQSSVRFSVNADYYPDAAGYNIAGYIEGSDPELKNDCVVIGGHFDHCGVIAGITFPGANDNGSGSAVVMEIDETYSKLTEPPKRSVLFVLFGGEEKGLRGSSYFADNFPGQSAQDQRAAERSLDGEDGRQDYESAASSAALE